MTHRPERAPQSRSLAPGEFPRRLVLPVFIAGLLIYFVAVAHRTSLGVAGVEALDRFGTEAMGLSVLAVVQLAMYALMQIPAGHLLDRFGPGTVMAVGSLIMAAGQAAMAVTDSLAVAIAARLLVGAGDAPIFISATRLAAAWFPPRRAPVMVQITGVVGQLGQFATAVPVAWVLHGYGWSPAFGMLAGVGVVAAVAAMAWVRLPQAPAADATAPRERLHHSVRGAVGIAGTRLGFWSHFVTPFSMNVLALVWGVPFFITAQRRTPAEASVLLLVMTAGALIAGPIAGVLTGRHPLRRSWLVLGSASLTAAAWVTLLAFSTPRPWWQLVVFCFVIGLGGPISLVGMDFARTWAPGHRLGVASGFVNVGGFAATITGVLLVGGVLQLTSAPGAATYTLGEYRLAFAALLVPWLVGVVGVVWSRRQTRADMAAAGVTVPPLRDAIRRARTRN